MVWCGVVWCGADWNLRQLDARLLYAPAKLGAGCSLMALAGLAAVLAWSEIVRAYGGLPNAYGGLPAAIIYNVKITKVACISRIVLRYSFVRVMTKTMWSWLA